MGLWCNLMFATMAGFEGPVLPYIYGVYLGAILNMQDLNIQTKFTEKKPEDVEFIEIIWETKGDLKSWGT